MSDFMLDSWSFSRYRNWANCAAQVKYQRLVKRKVSNAAMDRGVDVHASLENAVKARAMPRKMHKAAEGARAVWSSCVSYVAPRRR